MQPRLCSPKRASGGGEGSGIMNHQSRTMAIRATADTAIDLVFAVVMNDSTFGSYGQGRSMIARQEVLTGVL